MLSVAKNTFKLISAAIRCRFDGWKMSFSFFDHFSKYPHGIQMRTLISALHRPASCPWVATLPALRLNRHFCLLHLTFHILIISFARRFNDTAEASSNFCGVMKNFSELKILEVSELYFTNCAFFHLFCPLLASFALKSQLQSESWYSWDAKRLKSVYYGDTMPR